MRDWIVTFGGTGKSPIAPGTAGSLATAGLVFGAHQLLSQIGIVNFWVFSGVLAAGMLSAGVASVQLGSWAIDHYARKDPGPFVLDEVAGVCLTMLFLPMYANWHELWVVLIAFGGFRIFDVWKPPPCRRLEKLPLGWGILMDDLMAAVYANILCQFITRLVIRF